MSKSTFRGTIVFVLLLIFIFILPDLISYQDSHNKAYWKVYSTEEKCLKKTLERKCEYAQKQHYRKKKKRQYHRPPAKFDPNTYQISDWMKLGLSLKQTNVILKFSKYGIKSNDHLKRIVVISDELFELIKDSTYYQQPERVSKLDQPERKEFTKKKLLIDLNTASEEELKALPGIGDFFARNIIKKREELGGYHVKEQLLEIWKFDQEKLDGILTHIKIEPTVLHKIDLNTANVKELNDHPYISWNLANSIVKLRLQNGKFSQIEDIKKSVLMTDELFDKLKPYLQIAP